MAHYKWLDELRQQTAREKSDAARVVDYGAVPLRARYLGNTVPGGNGRMERRMGVPGYEFGTSMPTLKPSSLVASGTSALADKLGEVSQPVRSGTTSPNPDTGGDPTKVNPYPDTGPKPASPIMTEAPAMTAPDMGSGAVSSMPTISLAAGRAGTPAATTGGETTPESGYRTTGMARIQAAARGEIPGYDAASQKALDDMAAKLDTQRQFAGFEAAMGNLSPEVAAARQAMATSQGNQAIATEQAALTGQKAALQQEAATTLASQGLAGQQFELDKQRFGIQQAQQMATDAGSGMSWETFHAKYPTANQADYDGMRKYGVAGQNDFTRKTTEFNALLATGDPANIKQAAAMWGDMFPGSTFNADQVIADVGADRFADGMAGMATLASTFPTWEAAMSSADGAGIIAKLGGPQNAKQIFDGLKVNAIDKQFNDIMSSTTLTPDQKSAMSDFLLAGYTGELDFDVTVDPKTGKRTYTMKNLATGETTTATVDPLKPYSDTEWSGMSEMAQFESFKATWIPSEVETMGEQNLINAWRNAGKPQTKTSFDTASGLESPPGKTTGSITNIVNKSVGGAYSLDTSNGAGYLVTPRLSEQEVLALQDAVLSGDQAASPVTIVATPGTARPASEERSSNGIVSTDSLYAITSKKDSAGNLVNVGKFVYYPSENGKPAEAWMVLDNRTVYNPKTGEIRDSYMTSYQPFANAPVTTYTGKIPSTTERRAILSKAKSGTEGVNVVSTNVLPSPTEGWNYTEMQAFQKDVLPKLASGDNVFHIPARGSQPEEWWYFTGTNTRQLVNLSTGEIVDPQSKHFQ